MVVFILWYLPYFGWIQYPFRLLGTWFHEMGHGLTALFVGGTFERLEIYENGGGVAYSDIAGSYLPYAIAKAFTAAGGLLGPAIVGALLIISGKSHKSSKIALRVLIGIMILSLLLWIRSFWGIVVLSSFSIFLCIITFFKSRKLEVITILFLGLQSVLSTYLQLDYLFTKQFERDGSILVSDTQVIAENTVGTYWMWAIFIIGLSIYILWKSLRFYLKK
ncbi:M50 family metallopeptidase [Aquimarina sp. 2201CG5-10]|uniref:M50 family metallopeptidase n=1 Tax=Aquimarina callyspongiae TaxID=3098150 RepID=UPI002AB53ADB|nr:M50 family metallopeptidase [Aquimarina sp. 2201CG5-10]MDY8135171.1 M50 family metallopeptidase [Aquimarina sp. 2201CG5-10]